MKAMRVSSGRIVTGPRAVATVTMRSNVARTCGWPLAKKLRTGKTAQVTIAGHAFVLNLRRGHYELAVDAPPLTHDDLTTQLRW
jgi:hypothetical protein